MANNQEARVKLTKTQLNRLKSAAKNRSGTILRLEDEELAHELFLTIIFADMSTDIKLSKTQPTGQIYVRRIFVEYSHEIFRSIWKKYQDSSGGYSQIIFWKN